MQQILKSGAALSGDQTASFLSDAIDTSLARKRGVGAGISLAFTGSPTGTVTVEGSLDGTAYAPITSPVAMTADPASGSPIVFNDIGGFNFLKLRWVRTGGTMTVTSAVAVTV